MAHPTFLDVTQTPRRTVTSCLILFILSLVFFLVMIQFPRGHNFDEFHYVPSAKLFLALKENSNWEHPPLGKELMAIGIAAFGDRPIGWRFMSAVFGSLTLVGMYLWGLAVFRKASSARYVAALTLFNSLLYVQARIGMLDTFMFAFQAWGLAAFFATWNPGADASRNRKLLAFAGCMFGWAVASKWSAVFPWLFCFGLMVLFKLYGHFKAPIRTHSQKKSKKVAAVFGEDPWYSRALWSETRWSTIFLTLGLIPVVAYFVTFIPFLFIHKTPAYTWLDLIRMQLTMYEGQLRVVTAHPYMSDWLGWPWLKRPIWYAFDREGDAGEFVRGVLLLGNPVIMWLGLPAVIYCLYRAVQARSRVAFQIGCTFLAMYLCWGIIPRKICFYYYYYPAGMTLSLALAYAMDRIELKTRNPLIRWLFLGACAAMFVYFFPILSGMKIEGDSYRQWMWFRSWI